METLEKDLVIISAAVHVYLNSLDNETTTTDRRHRYTQIIHPEISVNTRIRGLKLGRWKQAFFPHINLKGQRDTYHGRGHRSKW